MNNAAHVCSGSRVAVRRRQRCSASPCGTSSHSSSAVSSSSWADGSYSRDGRTRRQPGTKGVPSVSRPLEPTATCKPARTIARAAHRPVVRPPRETFLQRSRRWHRSKRWIPASGSPGEPIAAFVAHCFASSLESRLTLPHNCGCEKGATQLIEHRRHCPTCNGMRTFRGDTGAIEIHTCSLPMTCSACGYVIAVAVPREEIEPRLGIYPRA